MIPKYEAARIRSTMRLLSTGMRDLGLESIVEPGSRILDIGCGEGYMLNKIAEKYPDTELYGIDKSQRMVKIAKESVPSADIVKADFQHIPFADHTFDAVVSTCILDQGYSDVSYDVNRMIWEVNRVLKSNGVYFVHDINLISEGDLPKEFSIMPSMFDRKNAQFFVKYD